MKLLLAKMEAHAASCTSVANHHSGKRRCDQCNKWLQLQKLRDRFTRQLLQAGAGSRSNRGGRRAPKGAAPSAPPLLQRSVTMCVDAIEEDDTLDLDLLPQLVEGELSMQRRRRESKGSGGGAGSGSASAAAASSVCTDYEPAQLCGKDGCTKPAWHSGMCQVELASTGRSRKRKGGGDDVDEAAEPAPPPSRSMPPPPPKAKSKVAKEGKAGKAGEVAEDTPLLCGKDGCTKLAWHPGMCDVQLDGRRAIKCTVKRTKESEEAPDKAKAAPAASKSAASAVAAAAAPSSSSSSSASSGKKTAGGKVAAGEEERFLEIINDGARMAQTPNVKGTLGGKKWKANAAGGNGGGGAGGKAKGGGGGAMTEDVFPPTVGNHIAIDSLRSSSADLPDTWSPIESAQPPARSNVAEVISVGGDGRCDAAIVCNCAGGDDKAGKAKSRNAGKCNYAGKCGSGTVVSALAPSQRQIVCSGCMQANLPHATPRLRCSGCDKLFDDGASYRRAPPVGDSHCDLSLCEECHGKLFSRYVDERKEVCERLGGGGGSPHLTSTPLPPTSTSLSYHHLISLSSPLLTSPHLTSTSCFLSPPHLTCAFHLTSPLLAFASPPRLTTTSSRSLSPSLFLSTSTPPTSLSRLVCQLLDELEDEAAKLEPSAFSKLK